MSAPLTATIVITTRNRSALLSTVCEAVLQLEDPGTEWELLVVDNGSTDGSFEVVQELAAAHPSRLRAIQELEVGISAARNRGIRESEGDLLLYIDDDAYPAPDWLSALIDAFADPAVESAGGPVEPLLQGTPPSWFHDRYLPYLSAWDRGPEAHELRYNEYPRGTNVAFRRSALERVGLFRPQLGRRGSSLMSGEEMELCLRIERTGGKILYVPSARVQHVTHVERLTESWLAARFHAQGKTEAYVDWSHGGFSAMLHDLKRYSKNAAAARQQVSSLEGGEILAKCQRQALYGYLAGMASAPFKMPKFRMAGRGWLPEVMPQA